MKKLAISFIVLLMFPVLCFGAEYIVVKGYTLTWMEGAKMLEVQKPNLTFNIKANGEIEKVKMIKVLLSRGESNIDYAATWGTVSSASIAWNGQAWVIYKPIAGGKKIKKVIGSFSVLYHEDSDYFELKSDQAEFRIYTCGMVEKKKWVEINKNEE